MPESHINGTDTIVIPIVAEDSDDENDFTTLNHRWKCFQSFLRYTRAIFKLVIEFLLNITSFDNTSVASSIVKLFITVSSYAMIYTSVTGQLMWAIRYLIESHWYILAVTASILLFLGSWIILTCYEWMWRWQERIFLLTGAGSIGRYDAVILIHNSDDDDDDDEINSNNSGTYRRRHRRPLAILNDDDMEDDLSLKAWMKQIGYGLFCCLIWSLYCVIIVKIDFWLTDQYIVNRPDYYQIELQLVNCLEASPILLGAALFLHYAYSSFYYHERSSQTVPLANEGDDGR